MKLGRNSPCPCGSGKKYKQCCLSKDQSPKRPLGVRTKALSGQAVKNKSSIGSPTTQMEPKPRPLKAVWINQPAPPPVEPVNLIERTFGEAIAAADEQLPPTVYPLEEPSVEADDTEENPQ